MASATTSHAASSVLLTAVLVPVGAVGGPVKLVVAIRSWHLRPVQVYIDALSNFVCWEFNEAIAYYIIS